MMDTVNPTETPKITIIIANKPQNRDKVES